MYQALFGSRAAERVLLYMQNYGEGHANSIAKTFKMAPSQIYKQLIRLEENGILTSRSAGRTKIFSINKRLAIKSELEELLERILLLTPNEIKRKYFTERSRPRRTGKAF